MERECESRSIAQALRRVAKSVCGSVAEETRDRGRSILGPKVRLDDAAGVRQVVGFE